ncbi:MocR-like pyridoxine biosynthesis transcription factor PdxR [Larkinella soli]|uniref:MocR-like pyridoxine biosynthesis transcription factor PdxR n=1 Tax=Larkinella soli TaxID=1770527 RepID=UPI000FFCBFCD|nr:PLP-dependent aminotransferase family protein [Larkinella soli]
MSFPKEWIAVARGADKPIFRQIADQIVDFIRDGRLKPGDPMPSSRVLAGLLSVHRKTVNAAYDDLLLQGWLASVPRKGVFIADQSPARPAQGGWMPPGRFPKAANFHWEERPWPEGFMTGFPARGLVLDDGFPDVRLAPIDELMREYRRIARRNLTRQYLKYSSPAGVGELRTAIADFLSETRRIQCAPENVLITRGAQMAFFMICQTLLKPGDRVAVSELDYYFIISMANQCGAELVRVPVDEHGLNVDALKEILQRQPVRLLYLTPHHHYPTTVTMPPERRMRLLALAQEHGVAVIEDDYDFDFRYTSVPYLPLISSDRKGNCLYVGTLSKMIAPSIRLGFVIAPADFIGRLTQFRRLIDFQGDTVLEKAMAGLFRDGTITRHLNKVNRIYHDRRDLFCNLLEQELGGHLHFRRPEGGMAVWARFDPAVDLTAVADIADRNGLFFNDGRNFFSPSATPNATRLGFASLNAAEIEQAVRLLRKSVTTWLERRSDLRIFDPIYPVHSNPA